jgi:hypothetical protein
MWVLFGYRIILGRSFQAQNEGYLQGNMGEAVRLTGVSGDAARQIGTVSSIFPHVTVVSPHS